MLSFSEPSLMSCLVEDRAVFHCAEATRRGPCNLGAVGFVNGHYQLALAFCRRLKKQCISSSSVHCCASKSPEARSWQARRSLAEGFRIAAGNLGEVRRLILQIRIRAFRISRSVYLYFGSCTCGVFEL